MIQDLEKQFGCRLFDRTTRAVSLTTAGKQLVAAAHQTISSLEAAASAIGQLTTYAQQTLSIVTTPLVAAVLMPEACSLFRSRHPDIAIRIIDVERNQIQPLVEAGEADVGFGMFLKPAAGLERQSVFHCELVCISAAQAGAPAWHTRSIPQMNWSALANRTLIGLPPDNSVQQLVDNQLASISRGNEERPTFNNIPTVLAMAEAGFGSAILPSFVIAAARHMNVDVALMDNPAVALDFYQINLKGRARAEAESSFVQALLTTMAKRCALPKARQMRRKVR
jgi:DNA-binding transcriptional LysR family regulator